MTTHRRHGNGSSERTILGRPLTGQLAGRLLQLPVDGDIVLAGTSLQIHERVRAPWISQAALRADRIYARSLSFGIVDVKTPSVLQLSEQLGPAFVSVDQGLVVALKACLVLDLPERMVGLRVGSEATRGPVLEWVICSRRGLQNLRGRLQ